MKRPPFMRQPGPVHHERVVAVPARGQNIILTLEAGISLLEAARRGFTQAGFAGGVVDIAGLVLHPFSYVIPALSKTPEHAAFYSETFRPAGLTHVEAGQMTLGQRDGQPFFHTHALWQESDGKRMAGHILPDATILAAPATVRATGLSGAMFEARLDPETNFKLFEPVPMPQAMSADQGVELLAVRLRPNQDFCSALETLCADRLHAPARLCGGVGSLIGAHFIDGHVVKNFATEVYIRKGEIIRGADDRFEAIIDVGLIDYTGAISQGRLTRGDNPVFITFELVLEAVHDSS